MKSSILGEVHTMTTPSHYILEEVLQFECTENHSPEASALCSEDASLTIYAHPDVATRDKQQSVSFTNFFLISYDGANRWPLRILCTNEAYFSLTGDIKSMN